MKIGMTTFGADGGTSGISQYVIRLLEQMSALVDHGGVDLLVYPSEQDVFVPHPNGVTPQCVDESIRSPLRNIFWHQVTLPRVCRRSDWSVLFLPAGNRRLPWSVPCPTVGTVHDFSSLHVEGKYDPARMVYITRVLPALIRRLTRVLTVSESSKRDIVEYAKVPEDRVHVTPLAADTELYHPRDPGECREHVTSRYPIAGPYVLYISRIEHPGKNHVRLIRAFEAVKKRTQAPHQLVLVGKDWGRADAVHRAAESSQFADDIVFPGFVASEDLPILYGGADAFVFPSLYEGFGLPVLEALASGVPTICSNVSSMPEVAGDAALQFDPRVEEDIAAALERVLTDAALAERLRREGPERASTFSWKRTAEETLRVLQLAAEEGPS